MERLPDPLPSPSPPSSDGAHSDPSVPLGMGNPAPALPPTAPNTLAGVVAHIVFQRGAFGVVKLRGDDGALHAVAGQVGAARVGERVVATGVWETEPKFGRQFRAIAARVEVPTSTDGLVACLAELVRGVGPARARRFVELAGGAVLAVARLDADDEDLHPTPAGLAPDEWRRLQAAWRANATAHKVEAGLASFGFTPALIARLVARYGDKVLEVVRTRPYDLAHDLEGVGWRRADEIALKAGLPRDTLPRKAAALAHALQEDAERDGHIFLPAAMAQRAVQTLCAVVVTDADIAAAAGSLAAPRQLVTVGASGAIGLTRLINAERRIAGWVVQRLTRTPPRRLRALGEPVALDAPTDALTDDPDAAIAAAEATAGLTLTAEQRAAVRLAHDRSFAMLTGGPGTGKTTVTKTLCALWEQAGATIGLCAPTGRAARRMAEVTGRGALTIHRLLGYNPVRECFVHDATNPLPWDVVVVDETSMIHSELLDSLLQACGSRTRVFLVGDKDQLPPVGPGAPFRDLIALGERAVAEHEEMCRATADPDAFRGVPVVRLTEIHRQAQGSRIIGAAREILAGHPPAASPTGDRASGALFVIPLADEEALVRDVVALVQHAIPQAFGIPTADVQVIAPMRKGLVGIVHLNERLRDALNPRAAEEVLTLEWGRDETRSYRLGDKVIQTKNDYARPGRVDGGPEGPVGVVNGEIGRIVAIDRTPKARTMLRVAFPEGKEGEKVVGYTRGDLANLELAYATTCHRAQGSQFPGVVVVMHDSHHAMLERALLYTAITRAEKVCMLVGTPKAIARAARTDRTSARRTTLPMLLAEIG